MDTLDIAPPACRSANGIMLESINPAGIFMHADIGGVEIMAYVISNLKSKTDR